MSDNNLNKPKKNYSADWLVGGILTKIGETFDRLTGRNWKASSSLSTSELIDRLKKLLDSEVKDLGAKGRFVPHNIKLKMQWNKFSTDSEDGLKKLEYEMMIAAIDHINDYRYHTYKPLKIEIKPDYFTEGIKFLASFGEFAEEEKEAVINISVPQMKAENLIPEPAAAAPDYETYIAEFTVSDKQKSVELKFLPNKRVGVGRTKENDLTIEDTSISKIHAALVLNAENQLIVADTGSTNGTFINGQRIAYGKGVPVGVDDKLKFGTVEVFLRLVPKPTNFETSESYQLNAAPTENYVTNEDYATNKSEQTMLDFETNRDYVTHKKEDSIAVNLLPTAINPLPTAVNPLNEYYNQSSNTNLNDNKTVATNDTNLALPAPQPQDTYQEIKPDSIVIEQIKEKQETANKIEKQEAENKENIKIDKNQSEVFSTEPRIKFNFDDEQK